MVLNPRPPGYQSNMLTTEPTDHLCLETEISGSKLINVGDIVPTNDSGLEAEISAIDKGD